MKLTMIRVGGEEKAAIAACDGLVLIESLNESFGHQWGKTIFALLDEGQWFEFDAWYRAEGRALLTDLKAVPYMEAEYAPLYRNPRAIWGVGANYWEKATQMAVVPPDGEPICFMKPATALIGHQDQIVLPPQSSRVTAEAELGIVIGRACKNVPESEAWNVIAGFVPTLDMTAQDIHARNPRFLGRSKVFDTFFSFGPYLITANEGLESSPMSVETVLNGQTVHRSATSEMIYSIPFLIAYFSSMMTLQPGDIIMTGTPGSVPIQPGDEVMCKLGSFEGLRNTVVKGANVR